MEITSAKNETYKFVRSLLNKKERDRNGLYTVEGAKSVGDAIEAGAEIKYLVKSSTFDFDTKSYETVTVKNELFGALCDTKTPQGVLAVLVKGKAETVISGKRYVYCDNVRDPGNLGTIIRTADAFGYDVLLSDGCCELYSPKVVRASMGSFFHINIFENVDYAKLRESGLRLIAGALSDTSRDFTGVLYTEPFALVVGNEANGVSKELLSLCDECVKIKISGRAESLNVGVAAALLMHEATRQNRNNKK